MSDQKQIDELKKYIQTAEESLEAAKKALSEITGEDFSVSNPNSQAPVGLTVTNDGKIIEGIFNGENMIGPEGKVFSVPANYASKSKLVEGDKLKLSVAEDGSFIFKQIGPVERKKLVGALSFEDNMYHVMADGKKYNLLYATVTFHKAKPGDKVTIVVPADGNSVWAAFENIIHDVTPTAPTTPDPDDVINLDLPEDKKEVPPDLPPMPPVSEPAPVPFPSAEPVALSTPFPTDVTPAASPELPPVEPLDPENLKDLEI